MDQKSKANKPIRFGKDDYREAILKVYAEPFSVYRTQFKSVTDVLDFWKSVGKTCLRMKCALQIQVEDLKWIDFYELREILKDDCQCGICNDLSTVLLDLKTEERHGWLYAEIEEVYWRLLVAARLGQKEANNCKSADTTVKTPVQYINKKRKNTDEQKVALVEQLVLQESNKPKTVFKDTFVTVYELMTYVREGRETCKRFDSICLMIAKEKPLLSKENIINYLEKPCNCEKCPTTNIAIESIRWTKNKADKGVILQSIILSKRLTELTSSEAEKEELEAKIYNNQLALNTKNKIEENTHEEFIWRMIETIAKNCHRVKAIKNIRIEDSLWLDASEVKNAWSITCSCGGCTKIQEKVYEIKEKEHDGWMYFEKNKVYRALLSID